MVISVIGIRFCFQIFLRRLGSFSNLQPTRKPESDSESDSADTEVKESHQTCPGAGCCTKLNLVLHMRSSTFGKSLRQTLSVVVYNSGNIWISIWM